jgi:hypothetical protein
MQIYVFIGAVLNFLIVAVKRSNTFRSQTLPKPEMSMSVAE